jgi:hypothetical protein
MNKPSQKEKEKMSRSRLLSSRSALHGTIEKAAGSDSSRHHSTRESRFLLYRAFVFAKKPGLQKIKNATANCVSSELILPARQTISRKELRRRIIYGQGSDNEPLLA